MVSAFWLLLCVHWPAFRNPLWLAVILPVSGPSYEEVFAFNDPPPRSGAGSCRATAAGVTATLPARAREIDMSSCLQNILISLSVVMKNG